MPMRDSETIEIRIRRDGTIYFGSLPEELLEVAEKLNGREANIVRRIELLKWVRAQRQGLQMNQKELPYDTNQPDT